jgi:hypothetical protein
LNWKYFCTWPAPTVLLRAEPKAVMPMHFLGKLLFPRLQPSQRWYQLKTIIAAVLIAMVFSGVMMGLLYWKNALYR